MALTITSESEVTSRTTRVVNKVRASRQYTVFKFVCASTWKGARTFKFKMTALSSIGLLSSPGL